MPHYHFHLHDGIDVEDEDGTELSGLAAARRVALTYLAEVLRDAANSPDRHDEWRINVTTPEGLLLFSLEANSLHAPAVGMRTEV